MDNNSKQKEHSEVESLMGLVELINAKGDQGEIEEILNRDENETNSSSQL